jgi:hypothetical protein
MRCIYDFEILKKRSDLRFSSVTYQDDSGIAALGVIGYKRGNFIPAMITLRVKESDQ